MHLPRPFVEPTQRRIRVRLAGTVIADSQRAQLLVQYGPTGLPTYYLPLADVRPDALVDESTGPDSKRRWSVVAGRTRAEGAAWTHPDPAGDLAALEDHVTFSWRQLDWYEEDERALVHARDPYSRVDTLRSSRRVDVRLRGELVASSVRPLLLFETSLPVRYYLPFEDVRRELLVASDLVTMCPYKGTARYWSIRVGDAVVPDIAWSYPDPIPENPKIKDLVCFFNERVDLTVDGVPQERPDTPWTEPPASTVDGVPERR
ncbi:MAG TPA: DUF427 domain-containing protein [Mycobacteriales bacterium]|jgi:uncharacterized protein (DUF427 family)|nr:DUF427 domain-containing protein [Mycobacteriales bacterium]